MQPTNINPALDKITSSLFRVSAKILIIQEAKLLVVQENQEWFGLPGGGVDHGEPIIGALTREINEEIDSIIEIPSISTLPIFIDSTSVFDGIPRLTLLYEMVAKALTINPNNLELQFRWVTLEEFSSLNLAPNILPMREIIINKLSV